MSFAWDRMGYSWYSLQQSQECFLSKKSVDLTLPPWSLGVCSQHHLLLGLPRRARHVVSRLALVLAEGSHLVLVLSTSGCLQVCVGNWGWREAHELTQGLWEGPQPVFHAGQNAVVAWKTQAGGVNRTVSPHMSCLNLNQHAVPRDSWLEVQYLPLRTQHLWRAPGSCCKQTAWKQDSSHVYCALKSKSCVPLMLHRKEPFLVLPSSLSPTDVCPCWRQWYPSEMVLALRTVLDVIQSLGPLSVLASPSLKVTTPCF